MSIHFRATIVPAAALLSIALLLCGCGGDQNVTYEDSGHAYTIDQTNSIAQDVPDAAAKGRPSADASELRQQALATLRSKGGSAAELAGLLTDTFPNEELSVPYYAELAVVEGTDAWIVLEVWGSEGLALDRTRLWVFDSESGTVLHSASFN